MFLALFWVKIPHTTQACMDSQTLVISVTTGARNLIFVAKTAFEFRFHNRHK